PAGKIDLTIPPGSSSGKRMRLKGRGIPGKTPGNLFFILEIVLPEKLSDKEKEQYKQLQTVSDSFKPRARLGV
ncbi:MAG: J domain-containing protein, partial [Gammaproteobacteria bacterium]|nr:J domain-containing protein [Gammaproteobacteria bacterium]